MRVLYFSQGYTSHDHRFLAALAKTEHEVSYLQLECKRRQTEDRPVPSQIEQIQWKGAGERFRWRDVPRLRGALGCVIRDIRPDLIHAGPIQSCAFLVALAGFHPLLTMSWGFDLIQDAERDFWWRSITRYVLRRTDFFVSDAEVTRNRAVAHGMAAAHTAVFPWGVDLEHFRPAGVPRSARAATTRQQNARLGSRRGSSALKSPFVLFCSRSWEPYYGLDVLAKAFVKVVQERPEVSLILLGGGSLVQSLRNILLSGNVLDRVQFGGQISQTDLPRWYHMADLYISPSHVDGSSVSLMEALACGLPVLVSDIPANREWVSENVNGWLFPDGDAEALAGKIIAVMQKRNNLTAIRQAARKTAEERADWSRNFPVLLQAYEQAIRNMQ